MSIHKEWICRYVQVLPRESGIHNFIFQKSLQRRKGLPYSPLFVIMGAEDRKCKDFRERRNHYEENYYDCP